MFVAPLIVWALVLGISPGLTLIAFSLLLLALDRYGGKGAQRILRSNSR